MAGQRPKSCKVCGRTQIHARGLCNSCYRRDRAKPPAVELPADSMTIRIAPNQWHRFQQECAVKLDTVDGETQGASMWGHFADGRAQIQHVEPLAHKYANGHWVTYEYEFEHATVNENTRTVTLTGTRFSSRFDSTSLRSARRAQVSR